MHKTTIDSLSEYANKTYHALEIYLQLDKDFTNEKNRALILNQAKNVSLLFLNAKAAHFTEFDECLEKALIQLDNLNADLNPILKTYIQKTNLLHKIEYQLNKMNKLKEDLCAHSTNQYSYLIK